MRYILYNPLSNNGHNAGALEKLKERFNNECKVIDVIGLDTKSFVSKLNKEDEIFILGGDGTVNHFVNDLDDKIPENKIYFFAGGTGNDFLNDIKNKEEGDLILINKYLVDLPIVTINGKKSYFLNGIGYGIDGYCCEEADRQRAKNPNKKINYTNIAIKGLLYAYKKRLATVTVDGETKTFKNVWLAPTMKGRYFGGGMMIAPMQDRLNEDKTLTNVLFFSRSKILTLIRFPKIFEGKHVKYVKNISIVKGYHFKVAFNEPCALQIDGETVLNVKEYEVDVPGK